MKLAASGLAIVIGALLTGAGCGEDEPSACDAPGGQLCIGDTVATCVDGEITKRDCGDEGGLECSYVDHATGFSCVVDACALVGPLGRCVGAVLTTCLAGEVSETTCEDGCAYLDDVTGYGCRAVTETAMVSGDIHYQDRPQTNRGPVGEVRLQPVRGAIVTVIEDGTNAVLATVVTADNGSYLARFNAAAGTMVHVTAVARSAFVRRPIMVTTSAGAAHGFGSPSFAADVDTTLDLVVTEAANEAAAFNVFDQTVTAMDVLTRDLGVAAPVALRLRWFKGSNDGTYFDGSAIHLLGASSDDDGYDDTVICHEIGHYVERTVGRSDSPGGGHNGTPTDPRLGWSEGYATYFAQATLGQPVYSDSNSGGGFFQNIDTDVTRATGSGLSQQISEGLVSEVLWDLGDNGAPDDDMVTTSSHAEANRVQAGYLKIGPLRNVGTAGVDLVDFLDGWFKLYGLTACAGVRDIVTAKHGFPYDYNGPGGACP